MRSLQSHLQLVSPTCPPLPASPPNLGRDGDLGDLALAVTLFAVFFLPILSVLAHVGRWSPAELGVAAAGSIFAGRALWDSARAALRDRRPS